MSDIYHASKNGHVMLVPPSRYVVFDLDGTLSNNDHRLHLAQAKEWDAFHAAGAQDEPIRGTVELYQAVSLMFGVIVLTGRNERYRLQTLEWLAKHEIYVDDLLMRPDNNFERDAEIKPRLLYEFFDTDVTKYNPEQGKAQALRDVAFVVEDRDSMVEAWRNLGFQCFQARPGAY